MSVTICFFICNWWNVIFILKCNWWKWEINVENFQWTIPIYSIWISPLLQDGCDITVLKYKGGIYKRNHNFCFRIFVFTVFSTLTIWKLTLTTSLIGVLLIALFFGDLSFHFFLFKGARLESSKAKLSTSIVQRNQRQWNETVSVEI